MSILSSTQNCQRIIRMRILISGINGFVGTNMYNYFCNKLDMFGLDLSTDQRKKKCRTYSWADFSELPDVDTFIHLAGMAHDTMGATDEAKYFEINVGLTVQIFDYFLKSSAKKFIFFSSVKAVADTLNHVVLTEEAVPNPKTPYGKSKLEAENYILSKHLPQEKRVYILRPAMIHGPGNKGNLNLLFSILKKGIPYPLGAYHNERSFTSIHNLLFFLEKLLELDVQTGIYNVCDDESLSTSEIAQVINQSLGKADRIWNIPKMIIQAIAGIGDIVHLPLNSERLKKMTESYVVSNSKLKSALKIERLPVSGREGLIYTSRSFDI
jgi:nucleoside-diphosphate-sugar epimerase